MKKMTVIIPVRKGSVRVKDKNIRKFSSQSSLLQLKIDVLKKTKNVGRIIVNSDSDEMIEIAKRNNVEFVKREYRYANSDILNSEYWRYLASSVQEDQFMIAQVTSPFVKISTYNDAISLFMTSTYDSVNSVSLEKKFLWLDGKPINYSYDATPKSQDLPEIMSLNFGITIIKKDELLKKANLVLDNHKFIILDKIQSIDIDDQTDFEIAEIIFEKFGMNYIEKKL
jgi:CMP-N,N'-diacetyllegionaminic acid synthase